MPEVESKGLSLCPKTRRGQTLLTLEHHPKIKSYY